MTIIISTLLIIVIIGIAICLGVIVIGELAFQIGQFIDRHRGE